MISDHSIIYELYVDKFAGSFRGLIEKLDYFTYLGVDTLWLLPHYPSPLIDGGYDISDYYGVRPELGTLDDFDAFITAAHSHGLKVITDLVLNHTSSEHSWFKQSRSSRSDPKRDWYLWDDHGQRFSQAFVHFANLKQSNWIFNSPTHDYYYATFYPQQPDLNWDNPEVVAEMLKVCDFWLDRGVDGFRLDAIARMIKRDGTYCFGLPETHAMLKRIRRHIDTRHQDKVLLAESGGWPDEARQFFGASDECHLVMNFPLSVRLLYATYSHDPGSLNDFWHWSGPAAPDCRWAGFLTSHDSVDFFFLATDDEKHRLRSQIDPAHHYSQPGIDSLAARVGEIFQGDADQIVAAHELLLNQPVVPIIYYGNELGQRNLSFSAPPSDFRDFVRGPMDWDLVESQRRDPNSVLNRIRNLIHSRQA